jgi:ABC-2 type transport system ATP-binding protein
MSVIEINHLCKSFLSFHAVDDLTFCVEKGSMTALLGSNGAGKTTTLMMLLGLTLPTSGKAVILGHDMIDARYKALPFMNFSSPYVDLPGSLTVKENLYVYGHLYGVTQLDKRIHELAHDLQFDEFLHKKFGQLSAGQKTRVSLAKSLLNKPKVLLLDEPTASLDPDTADWVRSYIQNYKKQTGVAILMASHNMREVERMADNILIMHQGQLLASGSADQLRQEFSQPDLETIFLDLVRAPSNNIKQAKI